MILQYFKKKENRYKKSADNIYLNILDKAKKMTESKYFKFNNFNSSFELISILLILYFKNNKLKDNINHDKINQKLVENFINDLDKSMRELGVGDMSIGKYVKKYVKKFYYRLKIIDPIFENYNEEIFIKYLNSLKDIDVKRSSNLAKELLIFYNLINKQNILW